MAASVVKTVSKPVLVGHQAVGEAGVAAYLIGSSRFCRPWGGCAKKHEYLAGGQTTVRSLRSTLSRQLLLKHRNISRYWSEETMTIIHVQQKRYSSKWSAKGTYVVGDTVTEQNVRHYHFLLSESVDMW